LDIIAAARLDFESPDIERFPALGLAIHAAGSGIAAATVLNAANEVAVDAFLHHRVSFGQMVDTLSCVMDRVEMSPPSDLEGVLWFDAHARQQALEVINAW